eukprot:TRINITY_DN18244_c0_g6_i1.p1 TRINITY_DN18244_c0_g6~~TRINITY_DN18244_c0_g6_i1.p1  ORF type:complete len:559 (+),score=148.88 TRINITY_DN18244_c0_g6_i1:79-1755(+)
MERRIAAVIGLVLVAVAALAGQLRWAAQQTGTRPAPTPVPTRSQQHSPKARTAAPRRPPPAAPRKRLPVSYVDDPTAAPRTAVPAAVPVTAPTPDAAPPADLAAGWRPAGSRLTADGRLRTAWATRELLRDAGRYLPHLPLPRPAHRPAECDRPTRETVRERLEYQQRRPGKRQLAPVAFYHRMREIAAEDLRVAVVEVGNGSMPATVNDPPIVDSHGGKHDVYRRWGSRRQWHLQYHRDLSTAMSYPQVIPPQSPLWAAGISGAWAAQGNVFTCDRAFSTGACLWDTSPSRVAATPASYEKLFVFCDKQCGGYFHFTHEHLPRLAPLHRALMADPDIKIMAPETGFVRAYLTDVLGFNASRLVRYGSARAGVAYYPQPQKCGNIFTTTLLLMRRIVFDRFSLPHWLPLDAQRPLVVVYGERSPGPKSRMPSNWEDVKTSLASHYAGRAEFHSALGVGVAKQIRLFNRADLVVGPHGANIANVMWMRHGTSVIELMSYLYGNQCYYMTAQRLGLVFRFIMHSEEDKKGQQYTLDFDEVRRHVDDVAAAMRGGEPLVFE